MRLPALASVILACVAAAAPSGTDEGPVSVRGVVRDALLQPIEGARVRLLVSRDSCVAEGRTDESGRFVLEASLEPVKQLVLESTADGRTVDHTFLRWSAGSDPGEIGVRLWDAARLEGRVLDPAGHAVPGAHVVAELVEARVVTPLDSRTTVADGRGAFVLDKVPLGDVTLRAFTPEHAPAARGVYLREDTDGVDLLLSGNGPKALEVRFEGLEESELAETRIRLWPRVDGTLVSLPWFMKFGTPDAGGSWTVNGLPPYPFWKYEVGAYNPTHVFDPAELEVSGAEGLQRVSFHAIEATDRSPELQMEGVLRDERGAGLAGERIVCTALGTGRRSEAVTGATGAFEMVAPLVPGERFAMQLAGSKFVLAQEQETERTDFDRSSWSCHEGVAEPGARIRLFAERESSVSGQIVAPEGTVLGGLEVQLESDPPASVTPRWLAFSWTRADEDGRFRFDDLRAFDEPLRVTFSGFAGSGRSSTFEFPPGGEREGIEVRLVPSATIRGVVEDLHGTPIPGARVWLLTWDFESGRQLDGSLEEVCCDREGRFLLGGIAPGGYYLEALVLGQAGAVQTDPFGLAPGEQKELTLRSRTAP